MPAIFPHDIPSEYQGMRINFNKGRKERIFSNIPLKAHEPLVMSVLMKHGVHKYRKFCYT